MTEIAIVCDGEQHHGRMTLLGHAAPARGLSMGRWDAVERDVYGKEPALKREILFNDTTMDAAIFGNVDTSAMVSRTRWQIRCPRPKCGASLVRDGEWADGLFPVLADAGVDSVSLQELLALSVASHDQVRSVLPQLVRHAEARRVEVRRLSLML